MKLDIISIGDELLIGQTINTNAHWISKQLNNIGFEIRQQLTIGDNEEVITSEVDNSLKHVDVVLITGGLGPTNDDLTMPVLNKYFKGELIEDKEVYCDIENLILSRGFEMNENNRKQALVPNNCIPIRNFHGTAPGLWFEKEGKIVVAMPGVPYEMKAMVKNTVIPWLKDKFNLPVIIHQMVFTQGIPEAKLAEVLSEWESGLPSSIKLAYLPSPGKVKLRLSSKGKNKALIERAIKIEVDKLYGIIPQYIYSTSEEKIQQSIGELLKQKNATVSTAESCTGGYIAHLITQIPGSSDYFKGSIISYANEVKVEQLDVSVKDINEYGAVSQQVVEQMAKGVLQKLKTDFAVASSGIAGPTGGTEDKPVGTVWLAVASASGVISKKYLFGKQREVNIERSAIAALGMLFNELTAK